MKIERVGDRKTTDDIQNRKTEDDFRSRLECTVETPLFSLAGRSKLNSTTQSNSDRVKTIIFAFVPVLKNLGALN